MEESKDLNKTPVNKSNVNKTVSNKTKVSKETTELQILKKYMILLDYAHEIVRRYPQSEKFALATKTKEVGLDGISYVIGAQKVFSKKDKLVYLNKLDINLTVQKFHMRQAYKYKYISAQNYKTWSEHISIVCNMLGAWIKVCVNQ
ncbi:MAG: four helix bundle protein [Clostridia bacterium]